MIEEIADPANLLPKPNLDPPEDNGMVSFVLEFALYSLAFYAVFVTFAKKFLDLAFMTKWKINECVGLDMSCKCVSALFALIATTLGIYIFFNADHDPTHTARTGIDVGVDHFLVFAMSYFIYDMYAMYEVYLAKNRQKAGGQPHNNGSQDTVYAHNGNKNFLSFLRNNPLMSAHHLVIALVFIPMMAKCRDHEPGNLMIAAALVMEASGPFVSMRSIMSDLGLKHTTLYMANGLAMIFVFFMCRIAVYPMFYKTYGNLRNISTYEAVWRTPTHCLTFILLTLLPQLYWFRLIARGAMKVVGLRGNDGTVKEESVLSNKKEF